MIAGYLQPGGIAEPSVQVLALFGVTICAEVFIHMKDNVVLLQALFPMTTGLIISTSPPATATRHTTYNAAAVARKTNASTKQLLHFPTLETETPGQILAAAPLHRHQRL